MAIAEKDGQLRQPRLSPEEAEMARAAQRCIMGALDHSRAASITLESDDGQQPVIQVPPGALRVIAQVLGAMSEGRPITYVPKKQELTTVEAAHYLNVSRPFVIKEIEAGNLPHRMVGTHRRIAFEDLVTYAQKVRARQQKALERMADEAREMGLDY